MMIRDMFADDINRKINGVIKVDQAADDVIEQELNEYVITRELKKHFITFFNYYGDAFDQPTSDMGVWISGFFGSGKSHFLKMLSYLLENKEVKGIRSVERFRKKFEDDLANVKISAYCKECKQERVFHMKPIEYYFETGPEGDEEIRCASLGEEIESLQNMIFSTKARQEKSSVEEWKWINWQIADTTRLMKLEYICSMDEKHHLDYIILTTDNSMMKIGQYPSIADMTFPELDAYKHVISREDRKELGTAIGLFASGVGAGSYVYLRRILERLVYQAKETAGDVIDDEKFEQARMSERIKMLGGYLPEVLINNTTIYGILSKGIHELSEEECRKYFPVVKECIYQILGMWESLRKKQADEAALSKALSAITTSIK